MNKGVKVLMICLGGILSVHLFRILGQSNQIFTGNGPNFFSCLGWMAAVQMVESRSRQRVGVLAIVVFALHAVYELLQSELPPPATFDQLDLIASALGSCTGWLIFGLPREARPLSAAGDVANGKGSFNK